MPNITLHLPTCPESPSPCCLPSSPTPIHPPPSSRKPASRSAEDGLNEGTDVIHSHLSSPSSSRRPASAQSSGDDLNEGADGPAARKSARKSSSSRKASSFSSSSLILCITMAVLGWGVVVMIAARRWLSRLSVNAKLTS